MQAIYVPKYKIYYRVSPKEPNVLQWSNKPFGPATQWQTAMRFGKPIRALDTDDVTGQGVVVLNDSSTYVGSGVRVWGRKFYPAGTRIYSLYAVGEKKMENKLKIKIHEAYDAPHWKADNIDGYIHTLWDKDIVKEIISTKYPDYPEITWKLYDNDGNLITIVSLAQDMLHVMRPGHYYSKSIASWGRAFWQGDQLENIKSLFDEFKVYDYVPMNGHQPKKRESLEKSHKETINYSKSKKTETFASLEDIEKIENYLRPLMVGKTYKDTIFLEETIKREINELFRKSDFHTLDGAEEDDLQFMVSFDNSWEDDGDTTAYEYVYQTDNFLLFSLVVLVKALDDGSAKITDLSAKVGD